VIRLGEFTLEVLFYGEKIINSFHTYSFDLKKKAVESYLSGESRKQIVEQFEIKNPRLLNEWVRKVQKEG
jgi:transposase-like protein